MADPIRTAVAPWARATAAGALIVTAVDAVLLERSKGFFRGGFLAEDYLVGPVQTAVYLGVSLLVDAALVGLLVALVAAALRRTRLQPTARIFAAFLVATGLPLAYDAVAYEVLQFLGDAFDLRLMIDLVGGDLGEILAVLLGYLFRPLLVAVVALATAAASVWVVHRHAPRVAVVAGREPVLLPLLVGLAGAVVLGVAASRSDVFENGLLRKPAGQVFASVVNAATDVDRDGFGIVGRSSDPDAFNASIYPYAVDVPGNGIDEDGVAGDLPATAAPYRDAPAGGGRGRASPTCFSSCSRASAPIWSARGSKARRSRRCSTRSPHGACRARRRTRTTDTPCSRGFTSSPAPWPRPPARRRSSTTSSREATRSATSRGRTNRSAGRCTTIGFDRADEPSDASERSGPALFDVVDAGQPRGAMRRWSRSASGLSRPRAARARRCSCASISTIRTFPTRTRHRDAHSDARLPRGLVPDEKARLWATYVNTAANVDRAIGAVIDAVKAARGTEPGIIVTSDHGESLFDEGFLGHAYALNEAQTRVPLVVANLPMVVPEPFVQSELRPALLAAMREPDGAKRLERARAARPGRSSTSATWSGRGSWRFSGPRSVHLRLPERAGEGAVRRLAAAWQTAEI